LQCVCVVYHMAYRLQLDYFWRTCSLLIDQRVAVEPDHACITWLQHFANVGANGAATSRPMTTCIERRCSSVLNRTRFSDLTAVVKPQQTSVIEDQPSSRWRVCYYCRYCQPCLDWQKVKAVVRRRIRSGFCGPDRRSLGELVHAADETLLDLQRAVIYFLLPNKLQLDFLTPRRHDHVKHKSTVEANLLFGCCGKTY